MHRPSASAEEELEPQSRIGVLPMFIPDDIIEPARNARSVDLACEALLQEAQ
jgi:hypothetical protein